MMNQTARRRRCDRAEQKARTGAGLVCGGTQPTSTRRDPIFSASVPFVSCFSGPAFPTSFRLSSWPFLAIFVALAVRRYWNLASDDFCGGLIGASGWNRFTPEGVNDTLYAKCNIITLLIRAV